MLFDVIKEERDDLRYTIMDEVISERTWIVSDEPVERKPMGLLKSIGFVLGGLLSSIPGILIVAYGVHRLQSGQFPLRSKFGGPPATGEEAIGLSWICIGFGLWMLGQLGTFCERWPLLKMFVYVLAGGAFFWGIVKLIRHF